MCVCVHPSRDLVPAEIAAVIEVEGVAALAACVRTREEEARRRERERCRGVAVVSMRRDWMSQPQAARSLSVWLLWGDVLERREGGAGAHSSAARGPAGRERSGRVSFFFCACSALGVVVVVGKRRGAFAFPQRSSASFVSPESIRCLHELFVWRKRSAAWRRAVDDGSSYSADGWQRSGGCEAAVAVYGEERGGGTRLRRDSAAAALLRARLFEWCQKCAARPPCSAPAQWGGRWLDFRRSLMCDAQSAGPVQSRGARDIV